MGRIIRKVIVIKENKCNIFISDDWYSFFSVPHGTPDSLVFKYLPYKTWYFIEHDFVSCIFFLVSWVPSVRMRGSFTLETNNLQSQLAKTTGSLFYLCYMFDRGWQWAQLGSHLETQANGGSNPTHTASLKARERRYVLKDSSHKWHMPLLFSFYLPKQTTRPHFNSIGQGGIILP